MTSKINPNGYSSLSNAKRAAKAAGLQPGAYKLDATSGKHRIVLLPPKAEPKPAPKARTAPPNRKAERVAKTQPKAAVEVRRESACEKPTKRVWDIASSMPGKKRGDVLAACEAQGIAYYTARTQYQLWRSAQSE